VEAVGFLNPRIGAPAGPLLLTPLLRHRGGVCMLYYFNPLSGVKWDRFLGQFGVSFAQFGGGWKGQGQDCGCIS
jgi:hypothetical protein